MAPLESTEVTCPGLTTRLDDQISVTSDRPGGAAQPAPPQHVVGGNGGTLCATRAVAVLSDVLDKCGVERGTVESLIETFSQLGGA